MPEHILQEDRGIGQNFGLIFAILMHSLFFLPSFNKSGDSQVIENLVGYTVPIKLVSITNNKSKVVTSHKVKETTKGSNEANLIHNKNSHKTLYSKSTKQDNAKPVQVKNFSIKGTRARPQYPRRALRLGQEGTVYLRVLISSQGIKEKIEYIKKTPYPLLNKAAIKAVSQWRFDPTIINGKAVKSWIEIPIEFKIG